jgi:hypothetical protein
MPYNRPRSFNSALAIRKAIKALNKQLDAYSKEKASDQKDKTRQNKSDIKWTDKGMLWVNAILMFGTFLLYKEATIQSKEVKDEFKIANTPYLQLGKVIDSIHPGQAPIIAYSIENLGKVPCKIIWAELGDSVSSQPTVQGILSPYNPFASSPIVNRVAVNMYSIDGSPYNAQYTTGYMITDKVYNDLRSKQSYLYFYGTICYINQMSNDKRIYEFRAKIIQNPFGAIEMLTNDNLGLWEYEVKHRKIIEE